MFPGPQAARQRVQTLGGYPRLPNGEMRLGMRRAPLAVGALNLTHLPFFLLAVVKAASSQA